MVMIDVNVKERSEPIKVCNIIKHETVLGDAKLELQIAWGISVGLVFTDRDNCVVEAWDGRGENDYKDAFDLYGKVLDKLNNGDYVLHLYDNGTSELELK